MFRLCQGIFHELLRVNEHVHHQVLDPILPRVPAKTMNDVMATQ
jgi:hypothetical protein